MLPVVTQGPAITYMAEGRDQLLVGMNLLSQGCRNDTHETIPSMLVAHTRSVTPGWEWLPSYVRALFQLWTHMWQSAK